MSNYTHWLHALTTDRARGDRIGGIIGPSADDDQMYTRGIPCYPAGTTFTAVADGPITRWQPSAAPTAWAVSLAIKGAIAPYIEQFRDGEYPAPLLAAGMTAAEIDAARATFSLQIGTRADCEGGLRDFVESTGRVMAP